MFEQGCDLIFLTFISVAKGKKSLTRSDTCQLKSGEKEQHKFLLCFVLYRSHTSPLLIAVGWLPNSAMTDSIN